MDEGQAAVPALSAVTRNENGAAYAVLTDLDGEEHIVMESALGGLAHGKPVLWVGGMALAREHVIALLPLLATFVMTGKLVRPDQPVQKEGERADVSGDGGRTRSDDVPR